MNTQKIKFFNSLHSKFKSNFPNFSQHTSVGCMTTQNARTSKLNKPLNVAQKVHSTLTKILLMANLSLRSKLIQFLNILGKVQLVQKIQDRALCCDGVNFKDKNKDSKESR